MLEAFSKKCTKRTTQIALGVLWIIDGLLQFQHQMFTASFVRNVITPAAAGQPHVVSGVMHFWSHVFLAQPVICNSLIIIIQVGIGLLILRKQTTREGLLASIIWGLFVWYVGEGLGGLLAGPTTLLMGAPGGALLYAVIALGVLPQGNEKGTSATRPASWLAYAWMVLWFGAGVLQLVGGQNTSRALSSMVAGMAEGAPGWLAALDMHVAHWLAHTGNWFILVLVAVQILVGLLVLMGKRPRAIAISIGIAVSLIFWVIGQSLGEYYSGVATDPNTAPLVILLGLSILGANEIRLELT